MLTVVSSAPCQIEILGQGPLCVEAARTRSPHSAGVFSGALRILSSASRTPEAAPKGRPAMMAPPANSSGYVASITAVMAPPAERPVMKTRDAFSAWFSTMVAIIDAMEAASPSPRRMSSGLNQLKQVLGLLSAFCSTASTAKPFRAASCDQPVPKSYPPALWPQPCSTTTSGAPGFKAGGA